MLPRLIPVLLIERSAAIHSVGFGPGRYLGDPLNIARLFSNLGADELLILDRTKSRSKTSLVSGLLERISRHVSCPVSYGGGIRNLSDVRAAFRAGVDKVVFRSDRRYSMGLISWTSSEFGSQSVVACVNYRLQLPMSSQQIDREVQSHARVAAALIQHGAGEVLFQNITRVGTRSGLDTIAMTQVLRSIRVPVVLSGGAASSQDIDDALNQGFAAIAVSTLFSLDSSTDAPLVSYFSQAEKRNFGWV